MKNKFPFTIILFIAFLVSCDTYKDIEPEMSPAHPIAGDYYVRSYHPDAINYDKALTDDYRLYIYNSSVNSDKYVWIDHGAFKVKAEYDIDNLSFNATMLPHQTEATVSDTPEKFISIESSMITLNEWPLADSIIFMCSIYDAAKVLDTIYFVSGHRTTGTEIPPTEDEF